MAKEHEKIEAMGVLAVTTFSLCNIQEAVKGTSSMTKDEILKVDNAVKQIQEVMFRLHDIVSGKE